MNRFLVILFLILAASVTDGTERTIHAIVALCDNDHQGIVPAPAAIGNGDKPGTNLYWGARYGVKTFFRNRSNRWKLVSAFPVDSNILERRVFMDSSNRAFLVADAYRGREIHLAISMFFRGASGTVTDSVVLKDRNITLQLLGGANLLVYLGHNGLMDFDLDSYPIGRDGKSRDVAVLCCKSAQYFSSHLRTARANPILLTTGFMAPEAYVLDALIGSWLSNTQPQQVQRAAAKAYNTYQKCGFKAATNLFYVNLRAE